MEILLSGLAARVGHKSFVADSSGNYHFVIDGHSLYLDRQGTELIIRSPLSWSLPSNSMDVQSLLVDLMGQVTSWSRYYPQTFAMNGQGNLVLEARLDVDRLELDELERVLSAQVGILESIGPGAGQLNVQARQRVWRP